MRKYAPKTRLPPVVVLLTYISRACLQATPAAWLQSLAAGNQIGWNSSEGVRSGTSALEAWAEVVEFNRLIWLARIV